MAGNLIIVHGGGPTAVINASLYGAIRQAQESPEVDRVLVAIGVPVSAKRDCAHSCLTAPAPTLMAFLMYCASSRMAKRKPTRESEPMSRRISG